LFFECLNYLAPSGPWRPFCRSTLTTLSPTSSLIKLTRKYGKDGEKSLSGRLALKLKPQKVVRGKKLCLGNYMIEGNIRYPADTSFSADGIKEITRAVNRVKKAELAQHSCFVNQARKPDTIVSGLQKVIKERVALTDFTLLKRRTSLRSYSP